MMLLRHRDESHQQDNNHSDTTSTISAVTTPMTQPTASTPNPPQANSGSLIQQMLSNPRTTASTNNHSPDGEISIMASSMPLWGDPSMKLSATPLPTLVII